MLANRYPSISLFRRSRWITLSLALVAIFALGALQARAATLTVNTTADSSDAAGSCGTGTCSLRDAINQAASGDTVNFSVSGTITLTSLLPAISKSMTIQGPTSGPGITISGANAYRIFTINSGTVAISNLTITDGNSGANNGGGIIINAGALTVTNCTFSGNSTTSLEGGGIANNATLTVINSTFYGNSAFGGGGILNNNGSLTVTNSTFSNNSATNGGGIYDYQGTITVTNSVFSANSLASGGGGIFNDGGTLTENHNLFYNNTGGPGITTDTTDITGKDPDLLPLLNYGGSTDTMLPKPGSPAICAGTATMPTGVTTPTTDQRGFTWNSSCVDIGAVQTNYVKATSVSTSYSGMQDVDLTGRTGTQYATTTITSGAVNLIGPGADKLTLDASRVSSASVVTVNSGAQATVYGITLTGGTGNGFTLGGGIDNAGTLTVTNSTISGNSSSFGGGIYNAGAMTVTNSTISGNFNPQGGGIYNAGAMTVTNSTISGNSSRQGGGIYNAGAMTVTNSTISGNTAGSGGGIFDFGQITLTNSTVSGNSALRGALSNGQGGGVYIGGGAGAGTTLILTNTIVSGNSASQDPDIDGTAYTSNGGTIVGGSTPIDLAPLGNYGGPTQTMPPLPGSPALNFGTYQTGEPTTDQRGAPRPTTGSIDSGSVQISGEPPFVASVTPRYDLTTGGASVTITGTGLDGSTASNTSVNFGSKNSVNATINSATSTGFASITAMAPAESAGTVDVTVTNNYGTSATSSNDLFTYETPLTITPVSTNSATYGAPFSETFTVSGGTGGYTLANSGTLPSGWTLTPGATGWTLTGTPTSTANTDFTLTATDKSLSANTTSQTYTIDVEQATPAISWATPAAIPYGTALSSTQLDATASYNGKSVAGTFAYSPATGTVLSAGTHTLFVTFTPTDSADYTTASGTVQLTVNQAAPTIQWSAPAAITYGTALTSTQLDATAIYNSSPVAGTFTYTPAAGTVLSAGSHTLSAFFTPNDTTDYQTATASVQLTVNPATLTVAVKSATRVYGATDPSFTGTVTGLANGDTTTSVGLTYATTATTSSPVGAYPITAGITSGNYTLSQTSGTLTVTPAPLTITAGSGSFDYGGTPPPITPLYSTFVNGDTSASLTTPPTCSTTATSSSPVGSYPSTCSGAVDANYSISYVPGKASVTPATLTVAANNAARVYGATNPSFTGTVTGAVNGDTFTESFSTTATTTSASGTYPIVPAVTGANLGDYTVTPTDGTLTVTTAATSVSLTSSTANANLNAGVTFTAAVTGATTGTPTGAVEFLDSSTVLGTGQLNNQGVATFTTSSLTTGLHLITAVYQGDSNFTQATSAPLAQFVTAPNFAITVNTNSLSLKDGQTGKVTLDFDPIGGLKATLQLVCSGLPDYATCTFSPTSLTADGSNKPQTDQITITTKGPNSGTVAMTNHPGKSEGILMAGLFWLPALFFGGFLFWQRKRLTQKYRVLLILLVLAATISGAVGCGSSAIFTGQGTSTVKIAATDGTTVHTTTINLKITK